MLTEFMQRILGKKKTCQILMLKGYEQVELSVTVEIVTGEVVDIIYQIFPIEKFGDPQWVKDYQEKSRSFCKNDY